MELKELEGSHKLSGVSYVNEMLNGGEFTNEYSWNDGAVCVISFILDGITYTAVEDANDGYRSAIGNLFINEFVCSNTFEPIDVICKHKTEYNVNDFSKRYCDILEIYSIKSGKIILTVGTDNTDDYYPSFVSDWNPKNL
jgi:hypothetical protein